jgi:valyl-tRNA synthetase
MVIPPPNVTGKLHLGHALTNSVEDAITRYDGSSSVRTGSCLQKQKTIKKKQYNHKKVTT